MDATDLRKVEDRLFGTILVQWKWLDQGKIDECLKAAEGDGSGRTRLADVLRERALLTAERVKSAWDTVGKSYSLCAECGKTHAHFNKPAPASCQACKSESIVPAGTAPSEPAPEPVAKDPVPEEGIILDKTAHTLMVTGASQAVPDEEKKDEGVVLDKTSQTLMASGDSGVTPDEEKKDEGVVLDKTAQTLMATDDSGITDTKDGGGVVLDATADTFLDADDSGIHVPEGEQEEVLLVTQGEDGSDIEVDGQTILKVSSTQADVPRTQEDMPRTREELPAPHRGSGSTSAAGKTAPTWPAEKGAPKKKGEEVRVEDGKKYFGNYELVRELSRGGMGIVYIAKQKGLSTREVALKVLIAGEGATEDQIKRFHREAESTAKLTHQHIVPIYDVGIVGTQHYFTMEFIKGKPLDALIKEEFYDQKGTLELIAKTARALHFAHQHEIIHRDIKPGNILVNLDGEPKLTDFGLAKDVGAGAEGEALTVSGAVMGTPRYMSPEQAEGRTSEIAGLSDMFSLASILYEMLAHQPPFTGNTIVEILKKVSYEDPDPPRKFNKAIHKDVETICLKALEKDMNKRYENCEEFAKDIERFLSGDPIHAKPVGIGEKIYKKARKFKGIVITGFIGLVLLLAAGAVFGYLQIKKAQEREDQFRQSMDTGRAAFEKKEYDAAMAEFLKALGVKEGDAEAQAAHDEAKAKYGEVQHLREEEAKKRAAELERERVWEENKKKFESNIQRARAEADGLNFEKAAEHLTSASALDAPEEEKEKLAELRKTILAEWEAHKAKLRQEEIDRRVETAASREKEAESLLEKDRVRAALLFEKAREAYERVLEMDPEHVAAKMKIASIPLEKMGPIYLEEESWDLARKAVADLDPEQEEVKAFLVELQERENQSGLYMEFIQKAREAIANSEWDRAIGLIEDARKKANTEEAGMLLVRARAGKYGSEAELHRRKKQWEQGVKMIEDALLLVQESGREDLKSELDPKLKQLRDIICQEGHDDLLARAASAFRKADLKPAEDLAMRALDLKKTPRAEELYTKVHLAITKPKDMAFVESGSFEIGSNAEDDRNPLRKVKLKSFYVDLDEVTNREYVEFVEQGGYGKEEYWGPEGWKRVSGFKTQPGAGGAQPGPGPASWVGGAPKELEIDYPVTGVSWYEARAFARFRGKRLPTAQEWEVAASWNPSTGARTKYPWGDRFDAGNPMAHGNLKSPGPWSCKNPARDDTSPLGCRDLAGNVIEWTTDVVDESEVAALKGGSYRSSAPEFDARSTQVKRPGNFGLRREYIGFRLAKDAIR